MLVLSTILAAVQPKVIVVGTAVWIGVSNPGPGNITACVTSVGAHHDTAGEFNVNVHACRSDDEFVPLRPGDSYLFLHSRAARGSNKYLLNLFVSESAGNRSSVKLEIDASKSTRFRLKRRPHPGALYAAQENGQIVLENRSDLPFAISADSDACVDFDRGKLLLLGHSRISLPAWLDVAELAVFDPAKPCMPIGVIPIHRRRSD